MDGTQLRIDPLSWKRTERWLVCLWVLAAVVDTRAGESRGPSGSAHVRNFAVQPMPFGQRRQEGFPWDGVRVQRWRRDRPEVDWMVLWIDLQTPGLGFEVTPVHYRKGPGGYPIQAAFAQTTVDFLQQHGAPPRVDLAVNTVAYWPCPAYDGLPVFLSEPVWQGGDNQRDPKPGALMLGLLPGRAVIGEADEVRAVQPLVAFGSFLETGEALAGIAVRNGRAMTFADQEPHGRTMAAVSQDGRVLILVLVDGYHPHVSMGLSLGEAAQVLQAAGAYQGIFLDGGGSATLVGRDDDSRPVLFNRPAGLLNTPGTLRYIAVSLGFTNLRRTGELLPAVEDWQASSPVRVFAETITWARVYPLRAAWALSGLILGACLLIGLWLRRRRRRLLSRGRASQPQTLH
jgi:hypothetical protein